MAKKLTLPVTLNQAFDLAHIVLANAHDACLQIVAGNSYATESEKLRQLSRLGSITVTQYELRTLGPAVDELRRGLLRTKPTPPTYQAVLRELDTVIPVLSIVAKQVVTVLPELAAEVELQRASSQQTRDKQKNGGRYAYSDWRRLTQAEQAAQVDNARSLAAAAATMLERLPAQLNRVREVAEAGTAPNFRTASTWLK